MKGPRIVAGGEGIHGSQPWVDFCADLSLEAGISALAARQHGVIWLDQLLFLGLGKAAVAKRAKVGSLHRIHRGVYAVRHPRLNARGRWMAATLAYGPAALLAGRSSAVLWGIHGSDGAKTHIILPNKNARARPGIEVHRSATLTEADIARVDGIPCTSLARTLVDFADRAKRREVERAVDRSEVLRIFDLRAVEDAIDRAGRRRGAALLRAVLDEYAGPTLTRSEFEERMFALCRAHKLARPELNAWITLDEGVAYQADFFWRTERLIVETDGYRFHSGRRAFEHDRLRDQRPKLARFEVIRFTWRQVSRDPDAVLRTTRNLLARLAGP